LTEGKKRAAELGRPVLVSSSERIKADLDPVTLFAVATHLHDECNYWGVPVDRSWIIGAGSEAKIMVEEPDRFQRAKTALQEILSSAITDGDSATTPVLMGAFRFDHRPQVNGNWVGFSDGLLSLPRIMVSRRPPDLWLTLNAFVKSGTNVESVQAECVASTAALLEEPSRERWKNDAEVVEETSREQWRAGVGEALQAVKSGRLRKVTLARMAKAQSRSLILPEVVLRSLVENYPQCRVFAIRRGEACFVGASPEELVNLHGTAVTSTCVAGSAPRGISEYEDSHFSEGLLESAKEREEHEIVVDWVSDRMQGLCRELHWNEAPEVLRLGNVQHLATRFFGTAKNDANVLDFVNVLHPTPAVGGIPLEPALEMIRRVEAFDRGWYTGPVGWVDGNGFGEFAIALRCALIRGKDAFLYAGAGIVSASDADREYEETTLKLKPLLTALGVR
jgi:menaquinone-specific isochorismate synthase